jgi:coenzyme F420-reducing hydrogenase delta subunit
MMKEGFKPTIALFHCVNALGDAESLPDFAGSREIRTIRMPCSSVTRDVYLLRAFEAGADAALVLVCPEGQCRYVDGNIRARKRVARVKWLLDEIGLGGERLSIHNVNPGDEAAVKEIIQKAIADVKAMGPNPAA